MKRAVTAFVLSALTYFGGHFYNNRWVRAAFFGTLMALWFLLYLPATLYLSAAIKGGAGLILSSSTVLSRIWNAGLGLMWAASAITAAVDSARPRPAMEERGAFTKYFTIIGLCSIGVLVMAGSLLVLAKSGKSVHAGPKYTAEEPVTLTEAPPFPEHKRYLGSTNTAYGESFSWDSNLVLAEGPGIITGNVFVDDKPCAGLKLRLFMSDKARSQWATTNKDGVYTISLPEGKYLYQGWELDTRSANDVLADKIKIDRCDRDNERTMSIAGGKPALGPDFYFVDPVIPTQPLGEVELKDVIFEWEPYPGASYYEVSVIDRGTCDQDRKFDYMGDWKNRPKIGQTAISASGLGIQLASGHNYNWNVTAYDVNGRFMSQTGRDYGSSLEFRVK